MKQWDFHHQSATQKIDMFEISAMTDARWDIDCRRGIESLCEERRAAE